MARTTEVNVVKMDDDRLVEFAGKKRMIKTPIADDRGVTIRLDFVNGETRQYTIVESLFEKFASHGAEQKLGDEIAGLDDVEDCVMAVDALLARLEVGEWGTKREANGMAGSSVLAKALMELTGKSAQEIKDFLTSKTQADKVALRSNPKLKPIIDKLEAAKASKKPSIDTDSLLDQLG